MFSENPYINHADLFCFCVKDKYEELAVLDIQNSKHNYQTWNMPHMLFL